MQARRWLLVSVLVLTGCASPGPDAPPTAGEKSARINTQLGVAYMRQNQLDQAMQKLEKALRQDPGLADAHAAIAVLYERLGEFEPAERHYRRSVELAPQDSAALNNYGRFLCNRGRSTEAEGYFQRATENPLYRTPEVPMNNAGTCLLMAGQRERAEQYFLRALQTNPRFAPALLRMAELRQQAGASMSARGFYQRYLEVATQTAESLWLGIQIERELDNPDAVASYALALKTRFPDTEQTRRLIEQEVNER